MPKNLTEGSLLKPILLLSIPLVLTNLLYTIYNITDTFWVGRLGAEAVAAVSLVFPIAFVVMTLGTGLTVAGGVMVGQYKGKNDQKNIDFITTQLFITTIIVATIIGIIGIIISDFLISIIAPSAEVGLMAGNYLKLILISVGLDFVYMSFTSTMRAIGHIKVIFYIVFSTIIINFLLDPIFIYGYGIIPALGVDGAAWATVATSIVSAVAGIGLLLRGKSGIHIRANCIYPDLKTIKKLIIVGWPSSIEFFFRSIGFFIITIIASNFGVIAVATFGLGGRLFTFALMPAVGISIAVSTLVSQNTGAEKFERVKRTIKLGSIVSFSFITILGIFVFIFAKLIAQVFVPGEEQLILEVTNFLRTMAWAFGFIGVFTIITGAIRGKGQTKKAMLLSLTSTTTQITTILITSSLFGMRGIWLGFPIWLGIMALVAIYIYKFTNWETRGIV